MARKYEWQRRPRYRRDVSQEQPSEGQVQTLGVYADMTLIPLISVYLYCEYV